MGGGGYWALAILGPHWLKTPGAVCTPKPPKMPKTSKILSVNRVLFLGGCKGGPVAGRWPFLAHFGSKLLGRWAAIVLVEGGERAQNPIISGDSH